MPYINLANFKYGLDTRKSELTSNPGTLETALDVHINQGGEIEKRKAFVLIATYPSDGVTDCYGLEATDVGLVTFGKGGGVAPIFPLIIVKQIAPPFTINNLFPDFLTDVSVSTNFGGKAWYVATFQDGFSFPFFDSGGIPEFFYGINLFGPGPVTSFADFLFTVIAGGVFGAFNFSPAISGITASGFQNPSPGVFYFDIVAVEGLNYSIVTDVSSAAGTLNVAQIYSNVPSIPAIAATGSFQITGGSTAGSGAVSSVKVNGVEVYNTTGSVTPLAFDTDNATTAAALARAINLGVSSPRYNAVQGDGTFANQITLSDASGQGASANGFAIEVVTQGDMCVDDVSFKITGGGAGTQVDATSILVGATALLNGAVNWITSDVVFAGLIAAAIQSFSATSGYTAFAVGGSDPTVRISKLDRTSTDVLANLTVTLSGGGGAIAAGTSGGSVPSQSLNVIVAPLFVQTPNRNNGATSSVVTATPSGGTPPYSYLWQLVSTTKDIFGSDAFYLLSPTAATTSFGLSNPGNQTPQQGRFTCKVTDSAGTPNVVVSDVVTVSTP